MTKNNWLIPSLIGIGLLSLALSFLIATRTEKQKPGEAPLARIELNLGKVFVLRKSMTQKETLTKRAALFALDSVETGPDGDATMDFDSSYRIRVEENSLITLDEEADRTVIIIKRGDVQVESFGKEGSVYISRDGIRWTATDYEQNYKKQAPTQNLPDLAPSTEGTPEMAAGKIEGGLTAEFIQETLRLQRGSFFKCYTQLLQKTPGVVGQASISFTIERSGKVYNAEIASSSISDANFKKCLVDTIRRVEFKSFTGDAISTVFPLKFE
ncbi:AgmX/PglI C-terminal domain-containing protein [Bdellovibrio svalbardensis]|uniref:AgmX/PglI C-terminal domain-containing protein n=1 Tax=Bdellovibrio svalbardensis TaxID=2972972 RepID=A0ABT6DPF4_9BACT|nr:AgmX/PglI C-terminal domain-containing protein [Bdellovibrio svalbardensis]MDG0817955.1 AgmX/PglI C-terminal domain-containing protein [Bdellovibrio svalbardensis]